MFAIAARGVFTNRSAPIALLTRQRAAPAHVAEYALADQVRKRSAQRVGDSRSSS